MKNFLSLTFLLCLFISNAQKSDGLDKFPVEVSPDKFTAREVAYMAIFPGCETIDINDKINLQKCLAQELNNRLGAKLENFAEELDKKGISEAVAKLQFVIDKNGKIIQVKPMDGGSADLQIASQNALIEISNEIGKISPASLEDGRPVNLVFQLPVKYVVTQDKEEPQYEWNELVLLTLKEQDKTYEVRMSKQEAFNVYEITKDNQIFLGKYNLINEIYRVEPYKTITENAKGKNLITEGMFEKSFYRFYGMSDDPSNVHIYKVLEGQENMLEKISFKNFFFLPKYSELLKRN